MASRKVNPIAVHATSDGWVVVTPLSYWSEERDAPPSMRLHLATDDVEAWTAAIHDPGARATDSATRIEGIPLPTAPRAGARVRTRVVRTWLFEPPSVCTNEEDGSDSARLYGRAPYVRGREPEPSVVILLVVSSPVVPLLRRVHVLCVDRAPCLSSVLALRAILRFPLRQLGRYLRVPSGVALLANVPTRHLHLP